MAIENLKKHSILALSSFIFRFWLYIAREKRLGLHGIIKPR
jgi:hypothetical protein